MFFGSSPSLIAMSQSTSLTGRVRGNTHLPSRFATGAYLVQGCLAVSAFRIPLHAEHMGNISNWTFM